MLSQSQALIRTAMLLLQQSRCYSRRVPRPDLSVQLSVQHCRRARPIPPDSCNWANHVLSRPGQSIPHTNSRVQDHTKSKSAEDEAGASPHSADFSNPPSLSVETLRLGQLNATRTSDTTPAALFPIPGNTQNANFVMSFHACGSPLCGCKIGDLRG